MVLWKRFLHWVVVCGLALFVTACSGQPSEEGGGGTASLYGDEEQTSEYVYVPEFYSLVDKESEWATEPFFVDDKLYYFVNRQEGENEEERYYFVCQDIKDLNSVTEYYMEPPIQEKTPHVTEGYIDGEGNLYVAWREASDLEEEAKEEGADLEEEADAEEVADTSIWLVKYDRTGKQIFVKSLEEIWPEGEMLWDMLVTPEGKMLISAWDTFFILNEEGLLEKTFPVRSGYMHVLWRNREGDIYCSYDDRTEGIGIAQLVVEGDEENGWYREVAGNTLPADMGEVRSISENRFLVASATHLCEHDMEKGESVELFEWLDCNINGAYVQEFTTLTDGRIAVYYNEPDRGAELIILTKTPASQVLQKQTITLATWYGYGIQEMEEAVLEFNRTNTLYQVVIKDYTGYEGKISFEDAQALLYADILSENPPDIIELTNLDIENLARKGAFEDLTPYLEESDKISQEDFVESVLNAYSFEGVQVTVPIQFVVYTLLGKSMEVGEAPGWTLSEVLTYAGKHPEATLIDYLTKEGALAVCLQYNSEHFIDYKAGKCNFDSPEFVYVLEFANQFPAQVDYNEERKTALRIRAGEVLLAEASISDVESYQIYSNGFGEAMTSIGYPTVDGSPGVYLEGYTMYGITATSDCKEGAWAFVESVLEKDELGAYFPTKKEMLEAKFAEAMEAREPEVWGYDGWQTELGAATVEEVDAVKAIIDMAKLKTSADQTVFNIIKEEAAAYFADQKSAEEVAKIIQSRVQLYVSENN